MFSQIIDIAIISDSNESWSVDELTTLERYFTNVVVGNGFHETRCHSFLQLLNLCKGTKIDLLRNFLQIVLLCDQGCQDQFLKPIYLLTPISRMPARARAAKVARAALTVRRMIEPPGTTVHPCHYDLVCPGSCPVNCIVQFLYVVVLEC